MAVVDAAHQIVVAQAHGTGSEQKLLVAIVGASQPMRAASTVVTANAGYRSEANLRALDLTHVDALIADRDLRRCDVRFATRDRYLTLPNPLHRKTATTTMPSVFTAAAFTHDPGARTSVCPAGNSSYRGGGNRKT